MAAARSIHSAAIACLAIAAGCARAPQDLLADLGGADPFARRLAAIALRDVAPEARPRAIRALLRLPPHADPALLRDADASLVGLARAVPDEFVGLALQPGPLVESRIVAALIGAGRDAVPTLVGRLDSEGAEEAAMLAGLAARAGGIPEVGAWLDRDPTFARSVVAIAAFEQSVDEGWPRIPACVQRLLAGGAAARADLRAACELSVAASSECGRLGLAGGEHADELVRLAVRGLVTRIRAANALAAVGPSALEAMRAAGVEPRWVEMVRARIR